MNKIINAMFSTQALVATFMGLFVGVGVAFFTGVVLNVIENADNVVYFTTAGKVMILVGIIFSFGFISWLIVGTKKIVLIK